MDNSQSDDRLECETQVTSNNFLLFYLYKDTGNLDKKLL